jgi:hypothetical protein
VTPDIVPHIRAGLSVLGVHMAPSIDVEDADLCIDPQVTQAMCAAIE